MTFRNPFKHLVLDKEEQEIEEAIESGRVKPGPVSQVEAKRLQGIARATLEKTRNINIRLSERDVLALKAKAASEGIPYQTLLGSVIHKYTESLSLE